MIQNPLTARLIAGFITLLTHPLLAGPPPQMVEDIPTQTAGSVLPYEFVVYHNMVLFTAETATHGRELWKSDGNAAGTQLLMDLWVGHEDSHVEQFTLMGDRIYFFANDGAHGNQIWKTDGTHAGTTRVTNFAGGIENEFDTTGNLTAVGSKLFFEVRHDTHSELWMTDGTSTGTALVIRFPDTIESLTSLTSNGNDVYFILGSTVQYPGTRRYSLWKSDSTAEGTVEVRGFNVVGLDKIPHSLTAFNGEIYLAANDGSGNFGLWASDGSTNGTRLLKSGTDTGSPYTTTSPLYATVFKSELYFRAANAGWSSGVWKTDGSAEGTVLVKDSSFPGGPFLPRELTVVGDILYFSGSTAANGPEIWKSDGTSEGTVLVKDAIAGSAHPGPQHLTPLNGLLYFASLTGLWKTDGTQEGTELVRHYVIDSNDYEGPLPIIGDQIFFRGMDGELWKSDGSMVGTLPVENFSGIDHGPAPESLTPFGDFLYFTRTNDAGCSLWKSDGTPYGTTKVFSRNNAYLERYTIDSLQVMGDGLYFTVDSDVFSGNYHNDELYRTDGTTEGTILVTSEIGFPNVVGNALYLSTADSIVHTDGTAAGTTKIQLPDDWSFPGNFTEAGNVVYFTAFNYRRYANPYGLWKTDGTSEGTSLLAMVQNSVLATIGERLVFAQTESSYGTRLWTSDGTEESTVPLVTIHPIYNGFPREMNNIVQVGDLLFFTFHLITMDSEL